MQQYEITNALVKMSQQDFMLTIASVAVQRGSNGPMAVIRSLAELMSAMACSVGAHERIGTAEIFRDVADQLDVVHVH